ncbi:MAG: hypothetical protein IJS83_06560 [Acholeplasmatales bacterium]|nr:hypothetical protein [Acholeplasmatales bacterium]
MNSKETNDSSANAQSNGWTFQYVAALVIFLEHMQQAKCFCVEGTDDIVVFLKDDKKICAQAKSSLNQDIICQIHFESIYESIRTLSVNNDADKLISVFNYHKPFGNNDSFSSNQFIDKKSYGNLTSKVQKKLSDYAKKESYCIDFEKMKFWFIRFEGDEPENGLKDYLKLKLLPVSQKSMFSMDDLMEKWLLMIQLNARDKKNNIGLDVMCGTLFGKILSGTSLEKILELIDIEIDPSYENEFEVFFKDYFSNKSQSFRQYNIINADFVDFQNNKKPKKQDMYKLFVDEYCTKDKIPTEIISYFNDYDDKENLSLDMYKLFVAYVCYKKNIINSIRSIFDYEDN